MSLQEREIRLRPAGPDDADFFYAARRAAFLRHFEAAFGAWVDSVQREIADREFIEMPVEIVEQRGTPIGYLAVTRHPDHLFLDEIALLPAAQRRGRGTELATT